MDALTALVLVGVGLTIFALVRGVVSMAQGGIEDQQASHRLMFQRIGWQALTVLLLVLLGALSQLR